MTVSSKFFGLGLVLAGTFALTACATVTSGTPSSSTSPAPVRPIVAGMADVSAETGAPADSAAPRSAIPWARVGPGWALAEWSSKPGAAATSRTVYLVSPDGARYTISRVGARDQVLAWSAAARSVLVERQTSTATRYSQTDMTSGRSHPLSLHGSPITYTADGRGLFAYSGSSGESIVLDDIVSSNEIVYPADAPGVGALTAQPPLQSADGPTLVFGAQYGLAVVNKAGHLLRALPSPVHGAGCAPLSHWTVGVVLAQCENYANDGAPRPTIWRMPLGGERPTRLRVQSSPRINEPGHFGYSDIWRTSDSMFGISPNSCGPGTLVRFDGQGNASPLMVALPVSALHGTLAYVGHDGGNLTVLDLTGPCNSPRNSLLRLDTTSGRVTTLLGPGRNGGSVDAVQPYESALTG